VTRYGAYSDIFAVEQEFSPDTIVDLAASAQIFAGGTLTAGILNMGDVFPDKLTNLQSTYATFGGAYVYGVDSPIGTDGRSYYVRLSVKF
jgi:iron complex outermembrane recepter protein